MKISHAKVLITFLLYIDTTFPETVKIIRTLASLPNGKKEKWKYGVDSFRISQSVCYGENSGYGNYCNTSSTVDETRNHSRYLCSCSKESSTVTYFKNKWSCMKNEEVRKQLGCVVNATLFVGEMEKSSLRTLHLVTNKTRKTKLRNPEGSCTINVSSSWYIGCFGKKVPLNRTTEMFLLQRKTPKNLSNRRYFIQVNNSIDPIFQGKVINLGITCEPPIPIAEGCLLFKLAGSFTCPIDKSNQPLFSSTINPTTSSLVVTSLSVAARPSLGRKQKNDEVSSFSQSGIIVGVTVPATLVLLLVAVVFICRRRRSRKDTHSSTSVQTNKNTCTVSRNVKKNSELELEEQNDYETCEEPLSTIYASRYDVPQQQVLQGTSCNQKTISSEGNSHSDGAYAALNIPEGHHVYGSRNAQEPDHPNGPGNTQEPVFNVHQDPKIMFQNCGSGIDQLVYYALEDLSAKDSGESVNNSPTEPEPMYNVLEDPEVMFQNYGSGIDQPVYYALEDLSVEDSGESVNNGPTEPEPMYNVLEDPEVMFQNCGSGIDQPVYYALEDLSVEDSGKSVNNGPTEPEPMYNVLEDPEVMFQNYGSGIDQPVYHALEDLSVEDSGESVNNGPTEPEPMYNVLEDPEVMFQNCGSGIDQPVYYALEDLSVEDSGESVNNGPTEPEPMYNVLEEPYTEGSGEPGGHGNETVDGPVYSNLEEPCQYVDFPCNGPGNTQEPVFNVHQDPKIMFQNCGSGIDQPVYYALEDLSVEDSGESVNNGPTEPEPMYNVLEDPEVMFQNCGSGIDQPVYYALEDLSVEDSGESVNNGPTEPEPMYNVHQDPKIMFQNCGSGIDQLVYYALEDLSAKDSGESVNNSPTEPEPMYNVLEDPEVMFQNCGSGIDQPVYYALEDLSVEDSGESVNNGPTEPEPMYNVLEEPYTEGSGEPGGHGNETVDGPVYSNLEEPCQYVDYPCKNKPVYKVLEAPGLGHAKKD